MKRDKLSVRLELTPLLLCFALLSVPSALPNESWELLGRQKPKLYFVFNQLVPCLLILHICSINNILFIIKFLVDRSSVIIINFDSYSLILICLY